MLWKFHLNKKKRKGCREGGSGHRGSEGSVCFHAVLAVGGKKAVGRGVWVSRALPLTCHTTLPLSSELPAVASMEWGLHVPQGTLPFITEGAGQQVGPTSPVLPWIQGPRLLGNCSLPVPQLGGASHSAAAPSKHSLPANRNHLAVQSPLPFAPVASQPSTEQNTKERVVSRWTDGRQQSREAPLGLGLIPGTSFS